MSDSEFENIIYELLLQQNSGELDGLGFHKKFKKAFKSAAKKIVKKVKKGAIPAMKIGGAFLAGGPVGAGLQATKLGAGEIMRKKAIKAAKKAARKSNSANQQAIAAEYMSQEGVNFNSPQAASAFNRYTSQGSSGGVMKYVLPAVAVGAVGILFLNR